jgi:tetratricopeptide (TPR) repeat protein
MKRILLPLILCSTALSSAHDKAGTWIEVRSPHFSVVTDGNEKQARHVADQFERMRSVFHVQFPKLQIDPPAPIIVLAVKDEKDFRALEPEAYLAKGQLKLAGLFLPAPDKNYILMRLEAEGVHPYATVYHEYTHLLLAKAAEWLPLWLNEGLAEFYQNTDIREKESMLGEPSAENLQVLRQNRLLPLPTLFAVDQKSPYYHEENKGSIFYAESWALTHYIQITDSQNKTLRLTEYVTLLAQRVDPVEAATRTFGDLQQLQRALERYAQQTSFYSFKMHAATEVDDSTFTARFLTPSQSAALRADFLAYNQRSADARALLERVLQEDPNNVSAHETMGYLAFREGHLQEAKKWYAEAVQLDSQSYLAHYYFAAMSMKDAQDSNDAQVENSLRQAIKLNPSFAPAFDLLGIFLGMHHKDLDEAHMMGVTAVALEPANVHYRINVANVLMIMNRGQSAIEVLHAAGKVAKTPEELQAVDNMLMRAEEFNSAQKAFAASQERIQESNDSESDEEDDDADVPKPAHPDTFVAKGPHRFLTGVLRDIQCKTPQMDLQLLAGGKSLALHSENYYKLHFTALNFTPEGDLNPCKDLEGRPAKVEYVESADESASARVLSIELHK